MASGLPRTALTSEMCEAGSRRAVRVVWGDGAAASCWLMGLRCEIPRVLPKRHFQREFRGAYGRLSKAAVSRYSSHLGPYSHESL